MKPNKTTTDGKIDRRTYLRVLGAGALTASMTSVAGCVGTGSDGGAETDGEPGGGGGNSDGDTPTSTTDTVTQTTTTQTQTGTEELEQVQFGTEAVSNASSSANYEVKVETDARWAANIRGSSVRSIQGTGSKTIDVDAETEKTLTVSFTKFDDDEKKLVAKILRNGNVIEESSTTESRGTVTISTYVSS